MEAFEFHISGSDLDDIPKLHCLLDSPPEPPADCLFIRTAGTKSKKNIFISGNFGRTDSVCIGEGINEEVIAMMSAAVPSAIRQQRLEGWVQEYSDAILRTCYLCLNDTGLAEDALQDTFLKAWKAMGAYERSHIQSDKAWLTRIALNVCHDIQRSRWMRHVDTRQSIDDLPPSIVAVRPEDHTLRLEIGRLPEKYRQVVLLCYYQELTEREAADVLGTSASTVCKRLKKAQALLKCSLTEEG